jgi:hypothetical protein
MIDFDDLCDCFASEPWAELDERPKLAQALRVLCERMPKEVYDELPSLLIFAPAPWKHGQVIPVPRSGLMIYFAPELEKESQAQSDFTVAHEFAHAALKHGTWDWLLQNSDSTEYLGQDSEIAAVNLVKRWGYQIPA